MKKTVQELAVLLGGTVIGKGDAVIEDVKGLAEAGLQDITFAVDPYTEYLPQVMPVPSLSKKKFLPEIIRSSS